MKKIHFMTSVFFVLLCTFMCTFSVLAESGGYLFKLKSDAEIPVSFLLCAEPQQEDILASELGIYTTDDAELIEYYKELGILEFYEENCRVELCAMPDTSEFSTANEGYNSLATSYGQLNVNAFWSLGITGKGVRVGIADSGISPHNDLGTNLVGGYDYYATSTDYTDGYGHGTMVAGFVAAKGSKYYGVAPDSEVVSLKCFNSTGNSSYAAIARAITASWSTYDCDILNMSLGTPDDSYTIKNAINTALDNGVILVAACGNHGVTANTTDGYYYPASYDSVISVGNIQGNDTLWITSGENDQVTVVAPGYNVRGLSKASGNASYAYGTGTSFSSPIVAGVIACMFQLDPTLTQAEVKKILEDTATDLGSLGYDTSYGYGKVNCAKIVKKLLDGKNYRSGIVEYKNTYNVALRNGLSSDYSSKLIFARYSGDKMTGLDVNNVSLASGEAITYSFATGDKVKLFELKAGGYAPERTAITAN